MEKQNLPPKWDWIPCNYNIKTELKKKVIVWNLQPSIVLTNPSEEGPDPHVKLYVDTEKSLQYSDELGWNWHKSWNLPNISVRLEIRDAQSGEALLSPKNLYAHIFAVKAVIDQPDNFHLVDVGIRGTNKLELVNGQAFFTAIKFLSTSYNHEGVKFHLVLCIYIMNEEDEMPKILNATISPPIFVDSRKQARDSQIILEKKMISFVEPFMPDNLEKTFIKRENKKKNDAEIPINNNSEGLFNYLTAPNIRHKVKHPLFLSLKFSQCVKLFYNTNMLPGQNYEQILEILQKKLSKEHCGMKSVNMTQKYDDKYFILYVEENADNFKNKKINEAIDSLQCPSLGIIYQLNLLPPLFEDCGQNEDNVNELMNLYRKNYTTLLSTSKMIRGLDLDDDYDNMQSDDEDGSEEESEPEDDSKKEEKPIKKMKLNPEYNQEINTYKEEAAYKKASIQPRQVEKEEESVDEDDEDDQDTKKENGVIKAPEQKEEAPIQPPQQVQQPMPIKTMPQQNPGTTPDPKSNRNISNTIDNSISVNRNQNTPIQTPVQTTTLPQRNLTPMQEQSLSSQMGIQPGAQMPQNQAHMPPQMMGLNPSKQMQMIQAMMQGQMQPGQMQPGQMQPGQMQPGQMQPGQMQPGQMKPQNPNQPPNMPPTQGQTPATETTANTSNPQTQNPMQNMNPMANMQQGMMPQHMQSQMQKQQQMMNPQNMFNMQAMQQQQQKMLQAQMQQQAQQQQPNPTQQVNQPPSSQTQTPQQPQTPSNPVQPGQQTPQQPQQPQQPGLGQPGMNQQMQQNMMGQFGGMYPGMNMPGQFGGMNAMPNTMTHLGQFPNMNMQNMQMNPNMYNQMQYGMGGMPNMMMQGNYDPKMMLMMNQMKNQQQNPQQNMMYGQGGMNPMVIGDQKNPQMTPEMQQMLAQQGMVMGQMEQQGQVGEEGDDKQVGHMAHEGKVKYEEMNQHQNNQ